MRVGPEAEVLAALGEGGRGSEFVGCVRVKEPRDEGPWALVLSQDLWEALEAEDGVDAEGPLVVLGAAGEEAVVGVVVADLGADAEGGPGLIGGEGVDVDAEGGFPDGAGGAEAACAVGVFEPLAAE